MTFELGIYQWLGPYKVCLNDDPRLIFTYLQQDQLCSLMLLYVEMLKYLILETIEVFELKVGTNSWLSEYIPEGKATQIYTFKHLRLQSPLAHWSQISCRAFIGCKIENLFKQSWSYDQDGRHAHIW